MSQKVLPDTLLQLQLQVIFSRVWKVHYKTEDDLLYLFKFPDFSSPLQEILLHWSMKSPHCIHNPR